MSSITPEEIKSLTENNEVNDELVFERITESSLKDIAELQKIFPNWTRENTIKKVRNTISGKDQRFVARKNREIIAHLKILMKKSMHNHVSEMTSLFVKTTERKKGIATKLIQYAIGELPKTIIIVTLAVDSKNKAAINLYKKMGFKKYGLLKKGSKINGKFVNNFLMSKEINTKK